MWYISSVNNILLFLTFVSIFLSSSVGFPALSIGKSKCKSSFHKIESPTEFFNRTDTLTDVLLVSKGVRRTGNRRKSQGIRDIRDIATNVEFKNYKKFHRIHRLIFEMNDLFESHPHLLKKLNFNKINWKSGISYMENFLRSNSKIIVKKSEKNKLKKDLKLAKKNPDIFLQILKDSILSGKVTEIEAKRLIRSMNLKAEYQFAVIFFSTIRHYRANSLKKLELPKPLVVKNQEWVDLVYEMNEFLKNDDRIYVHFKALMTEYDHVRKNQSISGEKALEQIFDTWENRGGFEKYFEIEPRFYKAKEWLSEVIGRPAMFNDSTFGPGSGNYTQHGVYSHRIQWNLLLREFFSEKSMISNQINGKRILPVDIKVKLGDLDFNLDWFGAYKPFPKQVWLYLFEMGPSDFSSTYMVNSIFKRSSRGIHMYNGVNTYHKRKY